MTRFCFCAPVNRGGKNFAATRRVFQFVGQNQVARTFTDSYFLGNFTEHLGDDSDESQQALSQRDRRPLT